MHFLFPSILQKQKNIVFVSFVVLTISISHFGVSGQYIQYKANAQERQSAADRRIDTVTQTEYEYYDDDNVDYSTTQSIATTTTSTTSTTTPKPITSYRVLTTHRNGFRPLLNFKQQKKFDTALRQQQQQQQYQPDSYTEASNESTFVQKHNQLKQSAPPPPPPQLRNAIAEVNRRTIGKEYAAEKSAPTSIEANNGNFSKRYARFLFKLRSG